MPRKQYDGNTTKALTLDEYRIYRVSLSNAESCPESVRKIFELVSQSKNIREAHFGVRREREDCRGIFDTNAAHDYNMRLRKRACDLARLCEKSRMKDMSEATWVMRLFPLVFLPFDRIQEEELDEVRPFHHWYSTLPLP